MFVVQALYPFSQLILKQQQPAQQVKQQKANDGQKNYQAQAKQANDNSQGKQSQKQQHFNTHNDRTQKAQQENQQEQNISAQIQQTNEISYLTFQKGDRILVLQTFENGWWYGNTMKQPDFKGYFPSNYVQVTTRPKPPPPPPSEPLPEQQSNQPVYDDNDEKGIDWVQNELKNITQGPVKSDYYLGIKGYKNVKIDDKNQNLLKGDHVKFDVSTGLVKIPVKDQAPAAKAVRQMGYYFDYHQWVEERNKKPGHKARPDPKKKKIKKLNLKGM